MSIGGEQKKKNTTTKRKQNKGFAKMFEAEPPWQESQQGEENIL